MVLFLLGRKDIKTRSPFNITLQNLNSPKSWFPKGRFSTKLKVRKQCFSSQNSRGNFISPIVSSRIQTPNVPTFCIGNKKLTNSLFNSKIYLYKNVI